MQTLLTFIILWLKGGDLGDFEEDERQFELVDNGNQNPDDDYFDQVVGCIQEILLDEEFERMQKAFSTEHCM